MPVDPSVLAALEGAVSADPANSALRAHFASLLLQAGDTERALSEAQTALAATPDSLEALQVAASASRQVGEAERAAGFERLLKALAGSPAAPIPAQPDQPDEPHQPAGPDGLDRERATPEREALETEEGLQFETELDAFLDDLLEDENERRITLADVGGLEDVKHRLQMSFLEPMRNPQLRKMFGKSLRGGLLLYGPPGCGKTFLARAVAGELGAHFINVGLHDVLDMWIGNSEKNIHALFERARRHTPCVLFLDEIDALGRKRSQLTSGAGRNVVVQFLDELDSTRDDNEGVFVLGATNQPWDIDAALRRPGRLDRMLLVLPPDEPARLAILELHLRDRPVGHLDLPQLARHTQGYSGADLRLLCETATESALWDSIQAGSPRQIGVADFQKALSEIRPSTRPWFETAYNYALFANEGGSYDDLLSYIRKHRLA